jgi:hypothetical protein
VFHSFVDFKLLIPANAALFYVFCPLEASNVTSGPSALSERRPLNRKLIKSGLVNAFMPSRLLGSPQGAQDKRTSSASNCTIWILT